MEGVSSSEFDLWLEHAIHEGDISQIVDLLHGREVRHVIARRWDNLKEEADRIRKIPSQHGIDKLVALRERIQIERHLQAILLSLREGGGRGMVHSPPSNSILVDHTQNMMFGSPSACMTTNKGTSCLNSPKTHKSKRQFDHTILDVSQGSGIYFKTVAVSCGRYFSVYDGRTEYKIGTSNYKRFTSSTKTMCGIFVHRTVHQAIEASFPKESIFRYKRRVVLKVKASGAVRLHGPHKLAFEIIKPVAVVCELPRSKDVMEKALAKLSRTNRDAPRHEKWKGLVSERRTRAQQQQQRMGPRSIGI